MSYVCQICRLNCFFQYYPTNNILIFKKLTIKTPLYYKIFFYMCSQQKSISVQKANKKYYNGVIFNYKYIHKICCRVCIYMYNIWPYVCILCILCIYRLVNWNKTFTQWLKDLKLIYYYTYIYMYILQYTFSLLYCIIIYLFLIHVLKTINSYGTTVSSNDL